MIKVQSGRKIWVPTLFIRWADKFEGCFYEFRKYYLRALEADGQNWT